MSFNIGDLKRDIVFQEKIHGNIFTFHSTYGLFSPKEVDSGSKLLLANIRVQSTDKILDLGCGYGVLGLPLATLAPNGITHLIDKDFIAVDFTKKNANLNNLTNTKVYLSNAFSNVVDKDFNVIVSNLPAKAGKEMFWIILNDAKDHLKKGGSFYVVVVAGLKDFIKRNFEEVFGNYEKIAQARGYMVVKATK